MRNFKEPNKKATLKDIGNSLGLSTMTISRALNDNPNVKFETRNKVKEKAKELGYMPNQIARSLVSNRTKTFGVIVPEIRHSFFTDVVHGIEQIAHNSGYQFFLMNTSDSFQTEKKVIDKLRVKRVDGLLISSSLKSDDTTFYNTLIKSGIPTVFFDRAIDNLDVSSICIDDVRASFSLTSHLIKLGRRNMAFIGGPQAVPIVKKRINGFIQAHENAGIVVNSKLVVHAGFNEFDGKKATLKLLKGNKDNHPDTIVAINDPVAIGAIAAIKESNLLVPDDIAVVGFSNDIRASVLTPSLTTVFQPAHTIGKRAAKKLIDSIENNSEPLERIEIKTEIIVRESCGHKLNQAVNA